MNSIDAIFKRKSTRRFKDKEVPKEAIELLIKAGMSAPSALNRQPWFFLVINSKPILEKISFDDHYASMVNQVPVAILVCGDTNREKNEYFMIQDCSAVVENILIAATALGFGSVWTTIAPFKDMVDYFSNLFDLPNNLFPYALIPIGYPEEELKERDLYDKSKIKYYKS